jgi:hypothetical protein
VSIPASPAEPVVILFIFIWLLVSDNLYNLEAGLHAFYSVETD